MFALLCQTKHTICHCGLYVFSLKEAFNFDEARHTGSKDERSNKPVMFVVVTQTDSFKSIESEI